MNRDEIKGKALDVKGRIKQATGVLTGNPRLESEGADEQATGRAEADLGRARENLGRAVEELGRKIKR